MTQRAIATFTLIMLASSILMLPDCGGKQSLANLPARDLFELGKQKYDDGKYLTATEYFQAIIYDYPGESLVDTAQYYLALSYFANDDFVLARVEFNRLVNYYPASVYAQQAMFMKTVSLFEGAPTNYGLDQTDVKLAVSEFEDFIIDFPESELLGDVQAYLKQARNRLARKIYQAGMVYFRIHAYEAAVIYFQKVIDEFTTSDLAGNAIFHMGEMDLKKEMYAEAAKYFDNFLILHPDHEWKDKALEKKAEAAFLEARATYENGQSDQARTMLQSYLANYPDSKHSKKATKLLEKIGGNPDESAVENQAAGS